MRFTLARVLSSAGPYSKFGENMRSAGVGAISSRYLISIRLNGGGNVHNHRRKNPIRYALKREASLTMRPTPGSAHSYEFCTPMIRKWIHPRDIWGKEMVNPRGRIDTRQVSGCSPRFRCSASLKHRRNSQGSSERTKPHISSACRHYYTHRNDFCHRHPN